MVYLLLNDRLEPTSDNKIDLSGDKPQLCIVSLEDFGSISRDLGINEKIARECLSSHVSKFESHDGFDFIVLNIPDGMDQRSKSQRVCLYLTDKLLVFVSDTEHVIRDIVQDINANDIKNISLGKILHLFFDRLTSDDSMELEKIEKQISTLEEELIVSQKHDFSFLVPYRNKLLTLKLYYEQLLEIYEAIEQNENGLIDPKQLRFFKILNGRANRLYNGVVNLRDYVTQVREAFQTQIDINLNSVMKIFTVITSVFLPLTLLVGWYGMNLQMPEFSWRYGYLFVIVLSIVIATGTLVYFKVKKWF